MAKTRSLIRRGATLCLAFLLCLSAAACAKKQEEWVVRYADKTVTLNEYRYWLTRYKTTFLYSYSDMTDTDEFWNQTMEDGMTAEEFLTEIVVENIRRDIVCRKLFDDYGLSVPESTVAEVDNRIAELRRELANDNATAFSSLLATYGVNPEMLREIYINAEKKDVLFDYLYGENGKEPITEDDLDAAYRESYRKIQLIYINNVYRYIEEEDGNDKSEKLTAEEVAAKNAIISTIEKALDDGTESYESLYETYSEDKNYPNGYYINSDSQLGIPAIITAAFTLEENDYIRVDTDEGVFFVKRYSLGDDKPYTDSANEKLFTGLESRAAEYKFLQKIADLIAQTEIDREKMAAYRLRDAQINYAI